MKRLAATALLISANALADAGSIEGDTFLACEPVEGNPAVSGFILYLDADVMRVTLQWMGSQNACEAYKSAYYYQIECKDPLIERPIFINRETLLAGAHFTVPESSGLLSYQCKEVDIPEDMKI